MWPKIKHWLQGLSFRTGLAVLGVCVVCYALSFVWFFTPMPQRTAFVLWVIFFGLAKTAQYTGLLILGKVGVERLLRWVAKRRGHYRIVNEQGSCVVLAARGAAIVGVRMPDAGGKILRVTPRGLIAGHGFMSEQWCAYAEGQNSVRFTLDVPQGQLSITYLLRGDNALEIYLDAPAEVELSRSAYLNLDGKGGTLADHTLYLNADCFIDAARHRQEAVDGTPYDYRTAKRLDGTGCDGRWLVADYQAGVMNEVAVLASHGSGRQLTLYSTLPEVSVAYGPGARSVAVLPLGDAHDDHRLIFMEFATIQ